MIKTYLLTALIAFAISFVGCFVLIPILRRLKAGQNILVYVKEHKGKGGTPTMGGIAFVFAAVLSTVLVLRRAEKTVIVCLAIGLAYMAVGLLDDFLKKKHKENLGLRAWQKFTFQALIAVFSGIYCLRSGLTFLYLPFVNISSKFNFLLSSFLFKNMHNIFNLTLIVSIEFRITSS